MEQPILDRSSLEDEELEKMRQELRLLQEEKDTEVYNLSAEKDVLAHKVFSHVLHISQVCSGDGVEKDDQERDLR